MKNQKPIFKLLLTYTVFAIAMAYMESTIVVYLRMLYYPNGFQFPLFIIPAKVALIEIGREAATIVMLWFVAKMAAHSFKEKFALFIFTFGVWDIFYYIWLKILLDWPAAWLEWDILFLIPAPWVAPWLVPALISCGFICASYLVLNYPERFSEKIFSLKEWLLEIAAVVLILWSFFWETAEVIAGEIPVYYPWWLFIPAYLLGSSVFIRHFLSHK